MTQNPGHPSPPFSHRRWLARVAIGSLLIPLTTASVIHTESPKAYGLSVADCSQTITLTDSTVVGPNDSYVATSTVDSDGDGTDDKCVLTFKRESVEMFWDTSEIAGDVDFLVVAGGGGAAFGGGGGGGFAEGLGSEGLSAQNFGDSTKVFVGDGGAGKKPTEPGGALSGEDSYLISSNPDGSFDAKNVIDAASDGQVRNGDSDIPAVIMKGGGGGAQVSSSAAASSGKQGGSSGGSSSSGNVAATSVSPRNADFGYAGGGATGRNGSNDRTAGGGGGAGGAGSDGNADITFTTGGAGGIGKNSSITGTEKGYSGGGGGSADKAGRSSSVRGGGSIAGFGGADASGSKNSPNHGTDGRGGGGGGSLFNSSESGFSANDFVGGNGGSGVVIVSFSLPPVEPAPVLGAATRTDGGFSVPVSNAGVYPGSVTLSADVASESEGSSGSASVSDGVATVSGLADGESAVLTVTASASGFSPATVSVTASAKSAQASLSITGSDVLRFGGSIVVSASGGSGSGEVTFNSLVSGDCVFDPDSRLLSSDESGMTSCVVSASRAGDANFLASSTESETFAIGKADREVVFTSSVPANPEVGDTYPVSAEATGEGTVTFTASGTCSINGSNVVSFGSAGSCTITASSASDTNYLAATDVTQVIVVGLANQTITFPAVSDKSFDDVPFQLSATSSRGLSVSYSTSSDACSVTTDGVVSIDAVGLCVVTASQGGVSNQVAAASDVSRSFRVQAVVPGAPRLTSVGFGDESLTVGFVAPDYVGGADISSYRAVATDGDDNQLVNNDCATSSPCTITGLTNGVEYTVTIAAVNDAGVGPVSNTSPGVTPATKADAVSGLSTVPGGGTLAVSWTKPTSFGGGVFASYVVTVSDGTVTKTETLDSTSGENEDSTTASFSGLTNGTAYEVTVVTNTSVNDETLASRTASITGIPAVTPSVVRDVSAVLVGNTGAFVSWAVPVSDGGLSVTSYAVTPESLSCDFENALDQFCDITGLARGVTVSINIAAVNGIGAGNTVTVTVTTPALPSSGGGGDDDDDVASPVPSATPTPAAGPRGPVGRPGPGVPPRAPGAGTNGGPGVAPPVPGGVTGAPVPPDRPAGTVGGVPVPTTTTASPGGRGVSVSAGGVDVGVDVPDPGNGAGGVVDRGGTPEPVVTPGQGKTIAGAGAAPGSVVEVWLPGRGTAGPTNIAEIPVGEDGSFSADVNVFGEEPLPIGRNVVQMVTTNAEGEQVLVDMPFTIAQGTPVPEVLRDTGDTPNAPVEGAVVTTAGVPDTTPRVSSDQTSNTIAVDGQSWAVSVAVSNTSAVSGEGQSTEIRSALGEEVTVAGSGFMPDTRVDVWAFSTPTLLGSATVDAEGSVLVAVQFDPATVPVGEHTLQVQAVAEDGFIRATNLPVTVEESMFVATSEQAGTLLWWIIGLTAAVVLIALITAMLIRRRQA